MAADSRVADLKATLLTLLRDDIVSFAELNWVSLNQDPRPHPERCPTMADAICDLIAESKVIVGDAYLDEFVMIRPWPEDGDPLRRRLLNVMKDLELPAAGEGFWIQGFRHAQ